MPSDILRSTIVSASLLLESNPRLSLAHAHLCPFRPSHDLLSLSSLKVALMEEEKKKTQHTKAGKNKSRGWE